MTSTAPIAYFILITNSSFPFFRVLNLELTMTVLPLRMATVQSVSADYSSGVAESFTAKNCALLLRRGMGPRTELKRAITY